MVQALPVNLAVKVAEIIRQKNKYSPPSGGGGGGGWRVRKEYHSEDCDFSPLVAKFENLDKITLGFGDKKTKRSVKDAYLNFVLLDR